MVVIPLKLTKIVTVLSETKLNYFISRLNLSSILFILFSVEMGEI